MAYRKIALFYGHLASNFGDLAINMGEVALLRQAFPDAIIHVVLFNATRSAFTDPARSSFGSDGTISFSNLDALDDKALRYCVQPAQLLVDCNAADADLVILASGEFLFSYVDNANAKGIFWRTLPIVAAKAHGRPCVVLPSTFGPFEQPDAQKLVSLCASLSDGFASRDSVSARLLKTYLDVSAPVLLDPAFFIDSGIARPTSGAAENPKHRKVLSLIMRSDGWGIRLSKKRADTLTASYNSHAYRNSPAFQFSVALCQRFLEQQDSVVSIWVQTVADELLAHHIKAFFQEKGDGETIEIYRPISVEDYVQRLFRSDYVVASRFHAIILALVTRRPVFGVYFEDHGHKMPGLFELLGTPERCLNLNKMPAEDAAGVVWTSLSGNEDAASEIHSRIDALKEQTISWLRNLEGKAADPEAVIQAIAGLGSFCSTLTHSYYDMARTKLAEKLSATEQKFSALQATLKSERTEAAEEHKRLAAEHARTKEELAKAAEEHKRFAAESKRAKEELAKAAEEHKRLAAETKREHQHIVHRNTRALDDLRAAANLDKVRLDHARAPAAKMLLSGIKAVGGDADPPAPRLALYLHYLLLRPRQARDLAEIAASGLFDPDFYLMQNPDIAKSGIDPLLHYMDHGAQEQRNPSPRFDTMHYLESYPDVVESEMNPLLHFIRHGLTENRQPRPTPEASDDQLDEAAITLATGQPTPEANDLLEIYRKDGLEAVIRQAKRDTPKVAAAQLIKAGKILAEAGEDDAQFRLAQKACEVDRSEGTLRNLFWVAQRTGHYEAASDAILELEQLIGPNPTTTQEQSLAKLKKSPTYTLSVLKSIPSRMPPVLEPLPRRVCYLLHNSLPYSSGGYATRAQGLARGLMDGDYDVVALTRPGFPLDTVANMQPGQVEPCDTVDAIPYVRTIEPQRSGRSTAAYVTAAADAFESRFREQRPALVIAASNYFTGLPGLIAARRLGIPFIYEVRGFWEVTRVSREESFATTPSFHVQRILEAAVATHADHVFTLTEPMKEELVGRGVPADRISLLPNACDPKKFFPVPRDQDLAKQLDIPPSVPVIGYVGTFVVYEGLEYLASACGLLKARGYEFRLLLVGNENTSGTDRGEITEQIKQIAEQQGFSDWLIMPGRVPHEVVAQYYSLIDICPFPRKPWPVCEMVSPLKPLEALAMEKAVVVSSVRALAEMIAHDECGLVFEKGSVTSLADTLERLIKDGALRIRLGRNGRTWVKEFRTWEAIAAAASRHIAKLPGLSAQPQRSR